MHSSLEGGSSKLYTPHPWNLEKPSEILFGERSRLVEKLVLDASVAVALFASREENRVVSAEKMFDTYILNKAR